MKSAYFNIYIIVFRHLLEKSAFVCIDGKTTIFASARTFIVVDYRFNLNVYNV